VTQLLTTKKAWEGPIQDNAQQQGVWNVNANINDIVSALKRAVTYTLGVPEGITNTRFVKLLGYEQCEGC
jgi:hypothetical protein